MTKRIFCFILASLMIVSLFSCKKEEETEIKTVETTAESSGEVVIDPQLEAIDGEGQVIRVLTRQSGLTANYWYDEMNSFGADMGNMNRHIVGLS